MAAPIFNAPGGRVQPRPLKPRAPRVPRVKAPNSDQVASQNAMMAFRQALQQLRAVTPQVDQASIYAPYRQSEQVTGQLGQGLQSALATSGQAAQDQYTKGLGQAQQQAAQFGISAGAGANPTALQNTGSQLIAQQSQAQQAAAPMAATQWQQLLERAAAAKVSDATLARQNALTSGEQALAGNIPIAINAEKTLGFQKKTQRENMGLAYSQLTAKERQFAQQYGLDALKTQQSGQAAATRADQTQQTIDERKRHDFATESTAQKALQQRAKKATASGLKGVSGALKALQGGTTGGTKPITGYRVTYVPDANGVNAGAPPVTLFVTNPKAAKPPEGYLPGGEGQPVYGPTGSKKATAVTQAQWDAQMRQLLAQNPGQSARVKQFLGPRPKK